MECWPKPQHHSSQEWQRKLISVIKSVKREAVECGLYFCTLKWQWKGHQTTAESLTPALVGWLILVCEHFTHDRRQYLQHRKQLIIADAIFSHSIRSMKTTASDDYVSSLLHHSAFSIFSYKTKTIRNKRKEWRRRRKSKSK